MRLVNLRHRQKSQNIEDDFDNLFRFFYPAFFDGDLFVGNSFGEANISTPRFATHKQLAPRRKVYVHGLTERHQVWKEFVKGDKVSENAAKIEGGFSS